MSSSMLLTLSTMQKGLFIFSLACAASCASANSLFPRATCSNFSSDGDPFTQPGPSSFIVSAGVVCTDSRGCSVPAGGFVTVERTLSLNSSSETVNAIFDLITSVVNIPFNASSTADTTHGTWTLDAGSSGYVAFTPNLQCVKGALSGCTGGNIQDGTSVEACAPYTLAGQTQGLDGTSRLVQTDEATARAVTCNPANTTNPADAPNQSCRSSGSSPESAASSVSLLGIGSVLATAALTLSWTGSLI